MDGTKRDRIRHIIDDALGQAEPEPHAARAAAIALGNAATQFADRLDGETHDEIGRVIFELDRLADEDEGR